MRILIGFCLALSVAASVHAEDSLPKVVLIGDSIRLGYAPIVARELAGKAVIVSPKPNGGDSSNVMKNLQEWALRERPAVVHFNCGIHDTKRFKATEKFQVPPDQYEANLRNIVERIRKETDAKVLFATTTPIIDARAAAARTKADYELLDASVKQYNGIATKVMQELRVPVDDLNALLADAETRNKLMSADGVHFTTEGREMLGKAVAEFIKKHLPAR